MMIDFNSDIRFLVTDIYKSIPDPKQQIPKILEIVDSIPRDVYGELVKGYDSIVAKLAEDLEANEQIGALAIADYLLIQVLGNNSVALAYLHGTLVNFSLYMRHGKSRVDEYAMISMYQVYQRVALLLIWFIIEENGSLS